MITLLWALGARGEGIEDFFPPTPLDPAVLSGATARLLGPPATVYDATTVTPGAASVEEAAIEAVLCKGLSPAPDALRHWGRYMLALLSQGEVPSNYRWFSAEHVGLPVLPLVASEFVHHDLSKVPAMLRGSLAEIDDLATAAVVVQPYEGGYRGIVVGITGTAAFEPFPRVWHAGDVASVPGTVLKRREQYQLFVTGSGDAVAVYDLPREQGRFDVDVPLPATAGVYRVAMDAWRPNSFPDARFFFSLYVDTPVPATAQEFPSAGEAGDLEAQFLALLNAKRAEVDLPPLERVGDSAVLRAFMASLPKAEGAQLRAWRQFGRVDPLPSLSHGTWRGVWGAGAPSQAGWEAAENPVSRRALLSRSARYAYLAADGSSGETRFIALVLDGPVEVASSRDVALAALSARFATAPTDSAAMGVALQPIAERVAWGKSSIEAALRDVRPIVKEAMRSGALSGSATMNVFVFDPQESPDVSWFEPPAEARAIGLAVATGTTGAKDGLQRAVVVVVTASTITMQ